MLFQPRFRCGICFAVCLLTATFQNAPICAQAQVATLAEMLESKVDLWGEAALRETNGPSYEFFEKLLPPLRYVNADFHFYPIVLSAPNAMIKARLISDGRGVNVRAGARSWKEIGTPIFFRVGPDELRFGQIQSRLEEPTLEEGFLPVVQIQYAHSSEIYKLEAFAATEASLVTNGVVFVKFSLAKGTNGIITVQLDSDGIKFADHRALNQNGQTEVWFDQTWTWERNRAHAKLGANSSATICIATIPFKHDQKPSTPAAQITNHESRITSPSPLAGDAYQDHRRQCVEIWNKILQQGMQVEVPEPRVNHAWRNLIIQNFSLIEGNRIMYSAGNQYEALYESEGSDAAIALMLWGHEADTRRLLGPLLDFTRQAILFNQAGHKLEDVARYYWQTRDSAALQALRPKWQPEVHRILTNRTSNGLLPREHYCNDIPTPVFSLNSNGKCWRGLRDLGPALMVMGETEEGLRLTKLASQYREDILAAVEKSTFTNTEPSFIPIALFGEEQPYDQICATRMGSYWNLMANFVLGFEVLGPGSHRESAMLEYIQQHGGLCMGMERSRPNPTFWIGTQGLNPLYGMRYALTLLRRDEPERALVTLYGMLAQGFTRNTFIAGEGGSLSPLDSSGRQFYCPPNSAGNAHFLQILRSILVQDWDLDDDGVPDTVRLCFATPRRWLEDGKSINIRNAPTAFGPVSVHFTSKLAQGEVIAEAVLPARNPAKKMFLRARVPEGWKVVSAKANNRDLPVDEHGTVDITSFKDRVSIHFSVSNSVP